MTNFINVLIFTGIDTDKNKYPIGSARVTFNNDQSYARAVGAAFVDIKTSKFTKKVSCRSADNFNRLMYFINCEFASGTT